jgi:hypothetical protein
MTLKQKKQTYVFYYELYNGNLVRITGFLDFVHRTVFKKLENTAFRKLSLVPSSGEEGGS